MPFLLMVFLVLVCLPEPAVWPKPLWTDSPLACGAAAWLTVVLTGLYAFFVARRARMALEKAPGLREQLLARYERSRLRQQIVLFVFYVLALVGLGWGWAVAQLWQGTSGPWAGAELLLLAPFVVAQVLTWAAYYEAEHAFFDVPFPLFRRQEPENMSLEVGLFRRTGVARRLTGPYQPVDADNSPLSEDWPELGARPLGARKRQTDFGTRASYVLFQLRQKLALAFLPVLLLLTAKELQRLFPELWKDSPQAVNLLGIAAVLMVFAAMPWIVRLMLGLTPMPSGPLRERLEASARRLRFRCSNILVWNTRHGMANAMVIGILPWLRYVIFTDRLLEDFTPDEIEAVFGHEVGHIRHHHMLYYFGFLTASILVLGWLVSHLAIVYLGPLPFALDNQSSDCVSAVSLVAVLLAYIFVVFGFLSRRCERQADVFGCRAVSCTSPHCRGHENMDDFAQYGQGLCATGINTFIRALEKVAAVNGISRDRPGFLQSWQHASIGRRIEFLQQVLLDLRVERRFQRRVFLFKALLLLILGSAVACILLQEAKTPAVDPGIDPSRAATVRER